MSNLELSIKLSRLHRDAWWLMTERITAKVNIYIQIKLLIENKLIICALGNLHYKISRAKFEPEPEFEPQTSGLEIRRSEVRIPVLVQMFLLRSYNIYIYIYIKYSKKLTNDF